MEDQKVAGLNISPSIAIIIAGAIIAGAVIWSSRNPAPSQPTANAGQPQAQAADVSKVATEGSAFIGNPNAPVTVAYWYDYQCPYCQSNEQTTMPQLISEYVKTGKVKVVFKDYQFLGADSQTAGLASRAVWDVAPDKFYDWHKAVFDKQDAENSGWGNEADVLALTKTVLGAEQAATVASQMKSKASEYQKEMEADKAEGTAMGINGTPGFIIGKQLLPGALPYAQVKAAVETALAAK